MGKWLMDLKTAQHLATNLPKAKGNFSFWFKTCSCCGADYLEALGHDCDNVIELETDEPTYKREQFQVIKGGKQ